MDKTVSQITIDQHYVPRSYLKNFANVKGTGKKEKALVSFYQFQGELLKENIPTKSICYKSYFYGEDGRVEKEFSEREAKWAAVIKEIINANAYCLGTEQESLIKEFVIYQFSRTSAMHNFVKESAEDLITTHMADTFGIPENDMCIKSAIKKKVDAEIKPTLLIDICDDVIHELDDLKISIIRFKTYEKLITSDMPVILLNPVSVNGGGLAMAGVFLIIPLSSDTAIAIYDEKVYRRCKCFMEIANEDDVINLNKYQMISAEERIISSCVADLKKALSYTDALAKRAQFQEIPKVDSSYDGVGTFFAMHSRSISYFFELSFCALPKIFKRIPKDCRGLHPRKFKKEAWLKLLFQEFRLPILLRENREIDIQVIEKQKEGYSQLRRYMEDYWEMPPSERTITPTMMRNIRISPIDFIPIRKNK